MLRSNKTMAGVLLCTVVLCGCIPEKAYLRDGSAGEQVHMLEHRVPRPALEEAIVSIGAEHNFAFKPFSKAIPFWGNKGVHYRIIDSNVHLDKDVPVFRDEIIGPTRIIEISFTGGGSVDKIYLDARQSYSFFDPRIEDAERTLRVGPYKPLEYEDFRVFMEDLGHRVVAASTRK